MTSKAQLPLMVREIGGGIFVTVLVGCLTPKDDVSAPPANTAISNVAGAVSFPSRVECDGPSEEIALLGGLCGYETTSGSWKGTNAPAGMAVAIGPESGALLLVYNRLERDPGRSNVAPDVKYSAFVLLSGGDRYSEETLGGWSKAEPVTSGHVTSQLVKFEACNYTWGAEGTFTWRSTQLRFAWGASRSC